MELVQVAESCTMKELGQELVALSAARDVKL
jgi:hypothetical protein